MDGEVAVDVLGFKCLCAVQVYQHIVKSFCVTVFDGEVADVLIRQLFALGYVDFGGKVVVLQNFEYSLHIYKFVVH